MIEYLLIEKLLKLFQNVLKLCSTRVIKIKILKCNLIRYCVSWRTVVRWILFKCIKCKVFNIALYPISKDLYISYLDGHLVWHKLLALNKSLILFRNFSKSFRWLVKVNNKFLINHLSFKKKKKTRLFPGSFSWVKPYIQFSGYTVNDTNNVWWDICLIRACNLLRTSVVFDTLSYK